jgi:heme A synthase
MQWNRWIRQTHRWLSVILTVAMVINLVAILRGRYSARIGLLAVAPFALLFLSGLYLFVLPYAAKWRGRGRRGELAE